MIFIDFKKGFDSVHRPSTWKVLEHYGIPEKMINIIEDVYEESMCSVRVGHEQTDWFSVKTGAQQRKFISLLLFKLVLDFALC